MKICVSFLALAASIVPAPLRAAAKPPLRAGAARIDITPGKDESLQMSGYAARMEGHKGIHDNLFVRAIVMEPGAARAAIITADLVGLSNDFWNTMSERIASESKIPRDNILIAGTHTHSAPSPGTYGAPLDPASKQGQYVKRVQDAMAEAVREAQQKLQPASIGAGLGRANVNVNRRALFADGTWWLGINPDGASDKTVGVIEFATASGYPITIFINYAVHGTGMGQENYLISADVPGATSRRVEQQFGDKIVAVWTSGAAGDQCPIYDRSARSFDGVMAIGRILGDEVIRLAESIRTTPEVSIRGAQKVISCPGQKFIPGPHGRKDGTFQDADAVNIRLSLLQINDIVLGGVSGEVLTLIGQRFKHEARLPNTMMVTHCNGSSGYLPDDAAFKQVSYEIQTARVKPGAEAAIVNGLLELMKGQSKVAKR